MLPLEALGSRIVIVGASGSGKSTLAVRLSRHLDATAVHLDQLYHRPGTDWRPRPPGEFTRLHEYAVNGESWVMDGNYSSLLEQRLARATGVIWLDMNRIGCLARYLKRSWVDRNRFGRLHGAADTVNWKMISLSRGHLFR